MTGKWIIDSADPQKVHCKLTEFHDITITHVPDEGIIIDVVDQRIGDIVHTQCEDFETLNCCMDPDEVGEDEECPNCKNGTLEVNEADEVVCRGECGAVIRKSSEKKQ